MEPYERLDEKVVYRGDRVVLRRRYRSHSGTEHTYEVTAHPGGVVVLPITEEGDVVLTQQFRPGPERVVWELPSGYIDDGEDPFDAATRELREETGFAGRLQQVGEVAPTPYSEEIRYVFAALGCRKVADQDPDVGEYIDVVLMDPGELRKVLRAGLMTTTDACYLALDSLGLL